MDYQEYLETLPDEDEEPWTGEAALTGKAIKGNLPPAAGIALFIGAGTCKFACAVGALGHKVMAMELSQEAVRVASQRVKENDLGLKVIPIWESYDKLKFDTKTFDIVVAERGVMSFIESPEKAVAELLRVAKPGAAIIATIFKRTPDEGVKLNGMNEKKLAKLFKLPYAKAENPEAVCLVFKNAA